MYTCFNSASGSSRKDDRFRKQAAFFDLDGAVEHHRVVNCNIVGCGPGFYRKAVSVSRSRETPYYNVENHTKISKGRDQNGTEGGLVPLHRIVFNKIRSGGMVDSQEELVGIRVSKKFSVVEESQG